MAECKHLIHSITLSEPEFYQCISCAERFNAGELTLHIHTNKLTYEKILTADGQRFTAFLKER